MDLNQLCMGCMEAGGWEEMCPHCGWVEGTAPLSPLHIPPRTLLNEKYLLGRPLGQGGFGITYLGWDVYLDRKLAIKEYFPRELVYRESGTGTVSIYTGTHCEQFKYGLSRFLDEAKNLARFEGHPNIVSVRDYFEENSTAYMVMNYLEGVTFNEYLKRRGISLSFDETLKVIMPVLDALRAVHEIGLLHRDISPDNIMITLKKRVMLLDFGAARHALGEKEKNFSIIIKPGFAPEEQYRSNGIQGPWTDIYAAAATIYRAVTATMPPESLDRLTADTLEPPSRLGVVIGPAAEAALLKALAVRAEDRYRDVESFQKALSGEVLYPAPAAVDAQLLQAQPPPNAKTILEEGQWMEPYGPLSPESKAAGPGPIEPGPASAVFNIGRANGNELILTDSMVSRRHAGIHYSGGRWYVTDLNSTHGTTVNGLKVNGLTELPDTSTLELSRVTLYFRNNLLLSTEGLVLGDLNRLVDGSGHPAPAGVSGGTPQEASPANKTWIILLATAAALAIFLILLVLFYY